MRKAIHWARSINFTLGGIVAALFAVSLFLVGSNIFAFDSLRADVGRMSYMGQGRIAYRTLYYANQYAIAEGTERARWAGALRDTMANAEERLRALDEGDASAGVSPVDDPAIRDNIAEREKLWRGEIKPRLETLLAGTAPEKSRAVLAELDPLMRRYSEAADAGIDRMDQSVFARIGDYRLYQWLFAALALTVLLLVLWRARAISKRVGLLTETAEKIGGGDLSQSAPVRGTDELALLGQSFNAMTAKLRANIETEREARAKLEELLLAITETAQNLTSATAEILAGTTQQAAGMREQSSAVAETVSTVDEVLQTSEQAASRAKAVAEASQHAVEISAAGRKAVEDSVAVMGQVKEQSSSIAESILSLAEQAQVIGEIIAAVNDIAEQSNLLSLNAAIEASRAGEQGKGFSVVASEIKALADQSKKATAQVRQILGEIQKATNTAVMATEEGSKSVAQAIRAIHEAGSTIKTLAQTVSDAAQASTQIAASAGQQATGMNQIHQAMQHINQASSQNLSATRQTEQAAQNLNALGARLKTLLAGYGR